jgi:hypothetical protein
VEPKYDDKGRYTKNSTYESDWEKEDVKDGEERPPIEPWDLWGPGRYRNPGDFDTYMDELTSKTSPKNIEICTNAEERAQNSNGRRYATQKHHLISVELFGGYSDLAFNSKLVNWDINDKDNGGCFPTFIYDIFRHDLQAHRGPHPGKYDDNVGDLLTAIEDRCVDYCKNDADGKKAKQESLKQELEALSDFIYTQLINWEWFLRSDALAERQASYKQQGLKVPS